MKLWTYNICVLLCLLISPVWAQTETEEEIKVNAEKLFENEEYVAATSLYSRLISLDPRNPDYNFRYGTCLLFNSYRKQEAIRFLNLAVNEASIDPRAFYFHGRALHLNYQFDEAKSSYQKYIQKREKADGRYDAERQIQMCDNGKRLLSTFTDIVVSEKKEIESEKFFRLYSNMETIGGTILVSADFQSKIDKKMGHVPIVHFAPNAPAIYYSSYGETGNTGKDIYIRRRISGQANVWGEPQLLPGMVNTPEDEDFPYMHPSGEYLYFSSKGHNSMGGYDVFYSLYDPNSGAFGTPQNVDFAISSPDDDLFYMVDSLHQSAYFASARQSQNGKLHVYRVRVARVPIQEVIIMGDYLSEINPENKGMTVTVSAFSNGTEVGKIKSDAKGKYAFVFPKGGKYNYEVKIDGDEDIYKFVVEVPFLDEFRPLKQKAIHTMEGDQEIVRIVNLFDEKVEGAEALMAEVIRKHAELEVNVDNFNLEELDADNAQKQLLADLGFPNMTMNEISDQLAEMTMNEQLKFQQVERVKTNLNAEIIHLTEELTTLDSRIDALRTELNTTEDPAQKHALLEEIKRLEGEKQFVATSISDLDNLRSEAASTVTPPSESGIGKLEILENQYNALIASEKEEEALKLLERNMEVIRQAHDDSPEAMVKKMIAEALGVQEEVRTLSEREKELEAEKRRLEGEIRVLDNQLIAAKKKEVDAIKSSIKDKENELALVQEMLAKTRTNLDEKRFEQSLLDDQIAVLQRAMVEENAQNVSLAQVQEAVKEAAQANAELDQSTTEKELASLEESYPELDPDYVPVENPAKVFEANYEASEQEILQNPALSENEKIDARLALNQETIAQIETRIEEIGKQPQTETQNKEKQSLAILKKELEQENKALDASRPVESALTSLQDTHRKEFAAVTGNQSLTEEQRIEQQLETLSGTLARIDERMAVLEEEEVTEKEQEEYAALQEWKQSLQQERDQLAVAPVQLSTTAGKLREDYAQKIEALMDNAQLGDEARLSAQLATADEVLNTIEERLVAVQKLSDRNPGPALEEEQEDLLALKRSLTEERAEWQKELDEIKGSSVAAISPEDLVRELAPEYDTNVKRIADDGALNEVEKMEFFQQEDQKLLLALNRELDDIQTQLQGDPENPDLIAREEMIRGILGEKEEIVANRQAQIDAMNQANQQINLAEIREAVLEELTPVEPTQRDEARRNTDNPFGQERAVLDLEQAYLDALLTKQAEANAQVEQNPENAQMEARASILSELVSAQEQVVRAQKDRAANSIGETEVNAAVARVDRSYGVEIGELEQSTAPNRFSLIAEREEALQTQLREAISAQENSLARTYSVEADLELMTLRRALEESEKREEEARVQASVPDLAESKEDFVRDLRLATLGEGEDPMTANVESLPELRTQDQMLIFYENTLNENLEETREDLTADPNNTKLTQRAQWLEEEIEAVRTKRRQIGVSIGELETVIADTNPVDTNPIDTNPIDTIPVDTNPIDTIPLNTNPIDTNPIDTNPIDTNPIDTNPIDTNPIDTNPIDTIPVDTNPVDTNPVDTIPVDTNPIDTQLQNENEGAVAEVRALQQQESDLKNALNDPDLSQAERRVVEAQLESVHDERIEKENDLLADENAQRAAENDALTTALKRYSNEENPALNAQLESYAQEAQAIEAQVAVAEKARSEEERNYYLKEATERQELLQDQINAALLEEKARQLEAREEVTLYSPEELEQRRRTFTVQIGELSTEIERLDEKIEGAKKKDVPALQTQRVTLLAQRTALELQLQEVERRLAESPVKEQANTDAAMDQRLSFNEERQTAASEGYAEYYKLANEALEVEQQIVNLETELKQEQNQVKQLLADPQTNEKTEEIRLSVERIKQIQQEIDKRKIDLVQRNYDAERALPTDEEEAMRMQNLVLRGIQPIKTAVVATALINMPTDGLAINETAPSVYSAENPIPVDVKNPTGLVYRVQIGAFAKPIPQDLFKEFNPVSGEKIDGTNITRYMAGFFNNSDAVVNAREQIRALGYNDAFVVAYCDGERIQFGEAKRREQEGSCVPKGGNELMMEVAVNTAEKLGLPLTNEVKEVPEHSYAQVPGAAETEPIEMKQGLFFTVQIGVFNRPVGAEYTFGMEELLTIRLPNGQIRYSSGMFSSVEEAMPRRQKALNNGVVGAFVCAYYKGERITLAEAKRLLAENGTAILQREIEENMEANNPNVDSMGNPIGNGTETLLTPVIEVDSATAESAAPLSVTRTDQRIQIISRKTFEDFPRDVLNRYNAEGNFYYDAKDQRVKSIMYNNVDDLPRLWNFRDDIDTIYISIDEMVMDTLHTLEVELPGAQAPGDFMDWLMRFNYRKEFYGTAEVMILRIYGIEPKRLQEVLGIVRKFGLKAREFEEQELENN